MPPPTTCLGPVSRRTPGAENPIPARSAPLLLRNVPCRTTDAREVAVTFIANPSGDFPDGRRQPEVGRLARTEVRRSDAVHASIVLQLFHAGVVRHLAALVDAER